MSKTILIKGGTTVIGDSVSQQDILIKEEKIEAIGHFSATEADEIIDATGQLVLPGAVDTHIHLNDVFMNTVSVHDYYTGMKAAAFGGVTSVIDFSNQVPGGSLMKTITDKKEEAEGMAIVDFGVHPAITEPTEETLSQIQEVVDAGSPTMKCYMTYEEDGLMIEHKDLRRILAKLRDAGGMMLVHGEDNDMIKESIPKFLEAGKTQAYYHAMSKPPEIEDKAITDCIQMVRELGGRLFVVHLASANGLRLISDARAEGLDVQTETCIHYLTFTNDILKREDGIKWICSPPLRNKEVQDVLWQGVVDGRIPMITTDDAAYSWEAKQYGIDSFEKCPNGMPGIEVRLNVLYTLGVASGKISLPKFVDLIATIPARMFGMAPQKGILLPGSDADIVLFDPNEKWIMGQDTLHMNTDWAAYEGMPMTGKIKKVLSRGELIVDGEELLGQKGRGRYIHRKLDDTMFPSMKKVKKEVNEVG